MHSSEYDSSGWQVLRKVTERKDTHVRRLKFHASLFILSKIWFNRVMYGEILGNHCHINLHWEKQYGY